jgi:hypothetical protein
MHGERGALQVNSDSPRDKPDATLEGKVAAQKELVEKLKIQWKLLWSERYNDNIKAEDVSVNDYEVLDVQRGTIIHATRDFKTLNFKEILHQHLIEDPDRYVQPQAQEGGWNKFVKTAITNTKPQRHKRAQAYEPKKREAQQPKKGKRGWLHIT